MSSTEKPRIGDYRRHLLVCTGTRCTQDGAARDRAGCPARRT